MDVDTMGGQIRRVELLKHREPIPDRNDSPNLLMLSSEPGRVLLPDRPGRGGGVPNHNAADAVVSRRRGMSRPRAPPTW